MKAPSARCQPHVCTITYNAWSTDQDGGRRVPSTRTASNIPCFVQPGKSQTVMESSEEGGLRRVTEISPGNAYFVVDVGCKTNDLIQWVDAIGRTHTFIVLGYSIPCGTQVLYVATIEERV